MSVESGFDYTAPLPPAEPGHALSMPAPAHFGMSDKKRSVEHDALHNGNMRISLALQASGVGVWEWRFQTNSLQWDDRMYEIYGIQPGAPITSERWKSVIHPDDLPLASGVFSPSAQQTAQERRRFRIIHPVKGTRVIEAAQELLIDASGNPVALVGCDRDVTEWSSTEENLRARAAELERMSLTDPVTGIGNRRKAESALAGEIARAQRYGNSLTFLYVDLDHFKQVNDAFGHDVGDLFLYQTAQAILQTIRGTDIACRLGGDEFCVIAPQISSEQAMGLADRIRVRLAREKVYPLNHPLTASFGVVQWKQGEAASHLMQRADQLMYQAKNEGRNQICADSLTSGATHTSVSSDAVAKPYLKHAAARRLAPIFSFLSRKDIAANTRSGISGEGLHALRGESLDAASPPPFN